jgi:hypothetical protein
MGAGHPSEEGFNREGFDGEIYWLEMQAVPEGRYQALPQR